MFDTPILIIAFNRADHVRQLLGEVKKQQPSKLYVFQDGVRPDRPDDVDKCKAVRDAVSELVDWQCELHTNYQEKNLGCGPGPFAAISWFFENEEYGIILEDDIMPHPLFFGYMADILVRYKDDDRIGMVTGHNLQRRYRGRNSYYFTYYMEGTLGWGTWKRVWNGFNFNIKYNYERFDNSLRNNYHMPSEYRRREHELYKRWICGSRNDCWDYQFDYYMMERGYLNVRANSCLTSHEGDDGDATHTGYVNPGYKMDVNESLFTKIKHPSSVIIDICELFWMYDKSLKLLVKRLRNK